MVGYSKIDYLWITSDEIAERFIGGKLGSHTGYSTPVYEYKDTFEVYKGIFNVGNGCFFCVT